MRYGGILVVLKIALLVLWIDTFLCNLREVGPSRKILRARGVGSERRKSVKRGAGILGALGATRKISTVYTNELIWPLLVTLLASPRMRTV